MSGPRKTDDLNDDWKKVQAEARSILSDTVEIVNVDLWERLDYKKCIESGNGMDATTILKIYASDHGIMPIADSTFGEAHRALIVVCQRYGITLDKVSY